MVDLNDLYFFAQVVQRGSFTKAARAIGVPKSRLSRRVAELETRLGVRLLQRTTRRLSLTDVGSKYYEQCQAMLAAAQAAEQTVENLTAEPRGQLRVTAPLGVAQDDVAVHLASFLRRYPRIRMELVVTNRRIDLVEEGVDVALRVRPRAEEDPHLVTRHLRIARALVVASPAFLKRYPGLEKPEDLRHVPALGFGTRAGTVHWVQTGPAGALSTVEISPFFFSDDFIVLKYLAVDGLGVTLLPEVNCKHELARGQLVHVLPEWQSDTGILHVVYPTTRGLSPTVRAFIDYLVTTLGELHKPLQPSA
ncbi:LysR substrate-binding domain-containing protein [Pendulispora brunnea]|uniref:LysR substrate-binding domain-containing protein n=1 Tax=Pendulispora brunnea TaxID=2905690 RepID=A0ABZ2K943_9BACT